MMKSVRFMILMVKMGLNSMLKGTIQEIEEVEVEGLEVDLMISLEAMNSISISEGEGEVIIGINRKKRLRSKNILRIVMYWTWIWQC
jgi:hypothetical protein